MNLKCINFPFVFCVFLGFGEYVAVCISFLGTVPMELHATLYMPP